MPTNPHFHPGISAAPRNCLGLTMTARICPLAWMRNLVMAGIVTTAAAKEIRATAADQDIKNLVRNFEDRAVCQLLDLETTPAHLKIESARLREDRLGHGTIDGRLLQKADTHVTLIYESHLLQHPDDIYRAEIRVIPKDMLAPQSWVALQSTRISEEGLDFVKRHGISLPKFTAPGPAIPARHTIIDTRGRRMEGTITARSSDSVTFVRASDGREFEIPFVKLSSEDQAFAASLQPGIPRGKPNGIRVMVYAPSTDQDKVLIGKLLAAGFDLVVLETQDTPAVAEWAPFYKKFEKNADPSNLIKPIDVFWLANAHREHGRELSRAAHAANKILVYKSYDRNQTIGEWLDNVTKPNQSPHGTYIKPEGNSIRYLDVAGSNRNDPDVVLDPRIHGRIIEMILRLK